jgi:hypothetical protein
VGGTYVIEEADLKLVSNRKPGRPPLNKQTQKARIKRIKLKKA